MIRQNIQKEHIIQSPIRDRLSDTIPDLFDNEDIRHMPVNVVYSKESKKYIIIKNGWIFNKLIVRGGEEILCNITAEVDTDEDAYVLRAAYVLEDLEDRRPFHIIEQCLCIHGCATCILAQNGEHSVYSNGGDRRSDNYERQSLLDLMCGMFQYKKVRIDILKRFAHSIGDIGITGLHDVVCDNNATLTISRIHKKNSAVKNANIIGQIESLKKQGKAIEDIKRIIGMEIYDILFDVDNTNAYETDTENDSIIEEESDNEDEENDDDCDYCDLQLEHKKQTNVEEEDADDDETQASSTPQIINPKCCQLSEAATEKVKSCFKPFFETIKEITDFLDSKTIINEDDAGSLDTLITNIQKYFTNFIIGIYAELHKQ